jgi:hypothetical protein
MKKAWLNLALTGATGTLLIYSLLPDKKAQVQPFLPFYIYLFYPVLWYNNANFSY